MDHVTENSLLSTISTGKLNALLHFHRQPINLVICQGSSSYDMKSYLEACFPLRCFQRLSVRNIAIRQCLSIPKQPAHQGFPHPSPLVLGTNPLKFQRICRIETELSYDALNPARVPF